MRRYRRRPKKLRLGTLLVLLLLIAVFLVSCAVGSGPLWVHGAFGLGAGSYRAEAPIATLPTDSDLCAELVCKYLADASVDFLCLLCGSGLAGTDGPYRLISDNDVLHILGGEVVKNSLGLVGNNVEVLAGLALLKVLTYAKDNLKACCKGELGLLYELGIGLAVILTAL